MTRFQLFLYQTKPTEENCFCIRPIAEIPRENAKDWPPRVGGLLQTVNEIDGISKLPLMMQGMSQIFLDRLITLVDKIEDISTSEMLSSICDQLGDSARNVIRFHVIPIAKPREQVGASEIAAAIREAIETNNVTFGLISIDGRKTEIEWLGQQQAIEGDTFCDYGEMLEDTHQAHSCFLSSYFRSLIAQFDKNPLSMVRKLRFVPLIPDVNDSALIPYSARVSPSMGISDASEPCLLTREAVGQKVTNLRRLLYSQFFRAEEAFRYSDQVIVPQFLKDFLDGKIKKTPQPLSSGPARHISFWHDLAKCSPKHQAGKQLDSSWDARIESLNQKPFTHFKIVKIPGFGLQVIATEEVPNNTFIGVYAGIFDDELRSGEAIGGTERAPFLFKLSHLGHDLEPWSYNQGIDATQHGNLISLINYAPTRLPNDAPISAVNANVAGCLVIYHGIPICVYKTTKNVGKDAPFLVDYFTGENPEKLLGGQILYFTNKGNICVGEHLGDTSESLKKVLEETRKKNADAIAHYKKSDYEKALPLFLGARAILQIFKRSTPFLLSNQLATLEKEYASILKNIASTYDKLGQRDKAVPYAHKCQKYLLWHCKPDNPTLIKVQTQFPEIKPT